jgi:transposase
MSFVCVQPMLSAWARRSEDLTFDKTDEKDAVLIARLTAQLRCYAPEPVDETWGRLRHLGARREQLLTSMVGQVQQIRALLECVWPAALECAQQPFRSKTWAAALHVICERDGGDLSRTRRLGAARFERAVRREVIRGGGQRPCLRIIGKIFPALADPAGVLEHRRGALERVQLRLADWAEDQRRLVEVETRMLGVLDELKLTELVTSIPGVSPVGAAAILAETGDPRRFLSARAVVKHAGLAPMPFSLEIGNCFRIAAHQIWVDRLGLCRVRAFDTRDSIARNSRPIRIASAPCRVMRPMRRHNTRAGFRTT